MLISYLSSLLRSEALINVWTSNISQLLGSFFWLFVLADSSPEKSFTIVQVSERGRRKYQANIEWSVPPRQEIFSGSSHLRCEYECKTKSFASFSDPVNLACVKCPEAVLVPELFAVFTELWNSFLHFLWALLICRTRTFSELQATADILSSFVRLNCFSWTERQPAWQIVSLEQRRIFTFCFFMRGSPKACLPLAWCNRRQCVCSVCVHSCPGKGFSSGSHTAPQQVLASGHWWPGQHLCCLQGGGGGGLVWQQYQCKLEPPPSHRQVRSYPEQYWWTPSTSAQRRIWAIYVWAAMPMLHSPPPGQDLCCLEGRVLVPQSQWYGTARILGTHFLFVLQWFREVVCTNRLGLMRGKNGWNWLKVRRPNSWGGGQFSQIREDMFLWEIEESQKRLSFGKDRDEGICPERFRSHTAAVALKGEILFALVKEAVKSTEHLRWKVWRRAGTAGSPSCHAWSWSPLLYGRLENQWKQSCVCCFFFFGAGWCLNEDLATVRDWGKTEICSCVRD